MAEDLVVADLAAEAAGLVVAGDLAVEALVAAGKIPSWAASILDEKGLQQIEEAVKKLESEVAVEVVPLIVRGSSSYRHVIWSLTFLLMAFFLVLEIPYLDLFDGWPLWLVDVLLMIFSGGLSALISRFDFVRRLLIPNQDEIEQVERRALLEFHLAGIDQTQGKNGVLLFLSLLEHRAVVLADRGVHSQISQQAWGDICQLLIQGMKQQQAAQGICNAIRRSGELLAPHFAKKAENAKKSTNELSNQLIIKE